MRLAVPLKLPLCKVIQRTIGLSIGALMFANDVGLFAALTTKTAHAKEKCMSDHASSMNPSFKAESAKAATKYSETMAFVEKQDFQHTNLAHKEGARWGAFESGVAKRMWDIATRFELYLRTEGPQQGYLEQSRLSNLTRVQSVLAELEAARAEMEGK